MLFRYLEILLQLCNSMFDVNYFLFFFYKWYCKDYKSPKYVCQFIFKRFWRKDKWFLLVAQNYQVCTYLVPGRTWYVTGERQTSKHSNFLSKVEFWIVTILVDVYSVTRLTAVRSSICSLWICSLNNYFRFSVTILFTQFYYMYFFLHIF